MTLLIDGYLLRPQDAAAQKPMQVELQPPLAAQLSDPSALNGVAQLSQQLNALAAQASAAR